MNNRSGIALLIAAILIAIAFYRWDDIRAGAQYLNSLQLPTAQHPAPMSDPIAGQYSTQSPTPTPEPTQKPGATPATWETGTDEPVISPASDRQERQERRPPAKCMDGSALTVTSRDRNQTNYKCGSGAVGAYLN